MFDGLDEIPDNKDRCIVISWLENQRKLYSGNYFIVTSRPDRYNDLEIKLACNSLQLQLLNQEQVKDFVVKYYLEANSIRTNLERTKKARIESIKQSKIDSFNLLTNIHSDINLAALSANPMMLTMISAIEYRSNHGVKHLKKKSDVYDQISNILLRGASTNKKRKFLQLIALYLAQNNVIEFKINKTISNIAQSLNLISETYSIENILKNIEQENGFIVKEVENYRFCHHTFQEYFASEEIIDSKLQYLILDNIYNTWWNEIVRFFAAKSDMTFLYKSILSNPNLHSLTLGAEGIEEGWRLNENERNNFELLIEGNLESLDPEKFKIAAELKLSRRLKKLAKFNTDKHIAIDDNYISCAEYQLFINEMILAGVKVQPDHWDSDHYLQGQANKPITGIRKDDAEKFILWLNKNKFDDNLMYQLPPQDENLFKVEEDNSYDLISWCSHYDSQSRNVLNRSLIQQVTNHIYEVFDINYSSKSSYQYFDISFEDMREKVHSAIFSGISPNQIIDPTEGLDLILKEIKRCLNSPHIENLPREWMRKAKIYSANQPSEFDRVNRDNKHIYPSIGVIIGGLSALNQLSNDDDDNLQGKLNSIESLGQSVESISDQIQDISVEDSGSFTIPPVVRPIMGGVIGHFIGDALEYKAIQKYAATNYSISQKYASAQIYKNDYLNEIIEQYLINRDYNQIFACNYTEIISYLFQGCIIWHWLKHIFYRGSREIGEYKAINPYKHIFSRLSESQMREIRRCTSSQAQSILSLLVFFVLCKAKRDGFVHPYEGIILSKLSALNFQS